MGNRIFAAGTTASDSGTVTTGGTARCAGSSSSSGPRVTRGWRRSGSSTTSTSSSSSSTGPRNQATTARATAESGVPVNTSRPSTTMPAHTITAPISEAILDRGQPTTAR